MALTNEAFTKVVGAFTKCIKITKGKVTVNFLTEDAQVLTEIFQDEFPNGSRLVTLAGMLDVLSNPPTLTRDILDKCDDHIKACDDLPTYLNKFKEAQEDSLHLLTKLCKELRETIKFLLFKVEALNEVKDHYAQLIEDIETAQSHLTEWKLLLSAVDGIEARTQAEKVLETRRVLWNSTQRFLDIHMMDCKYARLHSSPDSRGKGNLH